MFKISGGAGAHCGAVEVAGEAPQLGVKVLGRGCAQCLEMANCAGACDDGAGTCTDRRTERFSVTSLAGLDQVLVGEGYPGGTDSVSSVAIATTGPRGRRGLRTSPTCSCYAVGNMVTPVP
jgi:hypothetical protein